MINNTSRASMITNTSRTSMITNTSRTSMITNISNSNFNKLSRRKSSVAEKRSKSKLIANQQSNFDHNLKQGLQSDLKSADSDDENSKKKVLNASIVNKCPKLGEKLAIENHFFNLLRSRNESKLEELVKMHLLLLIDLDGENFSNVFEDVQVTKKSNVLKKKKQDKNDNKGNRSIFYYLKLLI